MKKITSILLSVLFFAASLNGVFAASDENRIKSLGILDGISEGDNVSRMDFTKIVMRLLGFSDEDVTPGEYNFTDVDDSGKGYVSFAVGMGIISRSEDGLFRPQDSITGYEAVKMLVCALGYGDMVPRYGSWPEGYLMLGARLGITNGTVLTDSELTYSDMLILADNMLDSYPLEFSYDGEASDYKESEKTIYKKLLSYKDMKKVTGILEETQNRSVIGADLKSGKGKIRIAGAEYDTDKDFSDYLGYFVEAYISQKDGGEKVVSVSPFREKNSVVTAPAEDSVISALTFEYYDSDDKHHTESIASDAVFVLNGRKTENPTDEQKKIYYGKYTLLDNNDDGKADVIFAEEAQSFVVSRVSQMTGTIYFDNDLTFRGSGAIKLDYDDDDKIYRIENADGEKIKFSDISVGNAVTIYADSKASLVRICVSGKTEEGRITKISSENEVVLNGKEYKTAVDENGNTQLNPKMDISAVYVIDSLGRICGISEELENSYKYAYVVGNGVDEDADEETIWFRLISGMEPEKHIIKSKDDEIISYYYQNDSMFTLRCEDKINLNGERKSFADLKKQSFTGKIIGYRLSVDGKINRIYTYELPGRIYNASFNAKLRAFSSGTDGRGYLMNNKTKVICIPKTVNSEDDWYVRINVQDESQSTAVYGVTAFPENPLYSEAANAEPVDFLIINAEMDASQPIPVQDEDKVCIVGSVSKLVSDVPKDDGEVVSCIEFLEEKTLKKKTVVPNTEAQQIADGLHKGDLIQYVEDSYGRIVTLRKIASMQGLGNNYKETIYGDYFGLAADTALERYDYLSNEMVDLITVNIESGERFIKIFTEDPQPVYRYSRRTGNIYAASAEDILSEKQVGSDEASKLYAYMSDNDVVALVIIED